MTTDKDFPPAAERLAAIPDPPTEAVDEMAARARRDRLLLIFAALGLSLGLIATAVAFGSRNEAQDRASTNAHLAQQASGDASTAIKQAQSAQEAAKEANRRLAQAGKPTVPIPTITIPPTLPPVQPAEGLSSSQSAAVQQLISEQLLRYQPSLTTAQIQQVAQVAASLVPKPADGKTPTTAQLQPLVAAALLVYCSDGRCTPKPGEPGKPGAQGTPGKDAPPVTDDQLRPLIAAALTTYCGQDSKPCDGKVGSTGATGATGPTGVSIVDTDCKGDGQDSYWLVSYSNGTTQTALGPCRIGPETPAVPALRTK